MLWDAKSGGPSIYLRRELVLLTDLANCGVCAAYISGTFRSHTYPVDWRKLVFLQHVV